MEIMTVFFYVSSFIAPIIFTASFCDNYPPRKTSKYWISFIGYFGIITFVGGATIWYLSITAVFLSLESMILWEEIILEFTDIGAEWRIWLLLIPMLGGLSAMVVSSWGMWLLTRAIANGLAERNLAPK